MIPYLPFELLRAILAHLSAPRDLARSCSTSKTFLSIAQPLLYHEVEFRIYDSHAHNPSRSFSGQDNLDSRTVPLWKALRSNPSLRRLVQKVKLVGVIGRSLVLIDEAHGYKLKDLVEEITDSFPQTKLVTFDNLSRHVELDEVVYLTQLRQVHKQLPAFAMVIPAWVQDRTRLWAAYERFRWIPFSINSAHLDVDVLLQSSHKTLRSLAIALSGSTSLSQFHRLERLSLRLFVHTPASVAHSIVATIDNLPALRALVLHGSARGADLGLLLQWGLLARSLPPSLTRLSLDFDLTPNDVLSFLRDLLTTSNLKRFNCLSETGEMEEVIEAFGKRGIMMSLNEDWDIWW